MLENYHEEMETIFFVQELYFEDKDIFLGMGEELRLQPVMQPIEASNRPVRWFSEKENIATVGDDGVVSAISIGKTVITACSDYGTDSCVVYVQKGTQLFDMEESLELILDEQRYQMNTNLVRGNGRISFESMNPEILEASDEGLIYLHRVGAASIVLKASETDEYFEEQKNVSITVRRQGLATPYIESVQNMKDGIKIKWSAVPGAQGYYLYREREGGVREKIAVLKAMKKLFYLDTNVENGVNYCYHVRAFNEERISAWSESGQGIMFLSAPIMKIPIVGFGCVTLQWEPVYGAMGYYIYRRDDEGKWVGIAVVENEMSISYIDRTVQSGGRYTYIVRAYCGEALGAFDSVGVPIIYLNPPLIDNVANADEHVLIQWQPVANADGYNVYRKTLNGKWHGIAQIESREDLKYQDTEVNSGVTYTYTVRAYANEQKSDFDPEGKSIVYLSIPVLQDLKKEKEALRLQWEAVKGAQGYRIYRRTAHSQWSRIATVKGCSSVKYRDMDIRNKTNYIYTVRAFHGQVLSYFDEKGISL